MNNLHNILLFDGVCNLCSGWVSFVIAKDKKNIVRFGSLQSDIGQKILLQYDLPIKKFESLVYIKNEKVLLKSTAVLHLLKDMGGMYSISFVFIIVPKFLRDFMYTIVAKNRYRWFGKKNSCMVPAPGLTDRFLTHL